MVMDLSSNLHHFDVFYWSLCAKKVKNADDFAIARGSYGPFF